MSAAFFGKGVGALGWAVMSDIAPREMTGISSGLFNTFGNLSSILTPIVIGAVVQHTGSFRIALLFVAGNALAAAASFLFMVGRIERLELPGGSADPVSRTSDLIR
jgi:ACS family glucarate transporter-like MFS transporter